MTKLQRAIPASGGVESHNGWKVNQTKELAEHKCNTNRVLDQPLSASASVPQATNPASDSHRRNDDSRAFVVRFWSLVDRSGTGCWLWRGDTQRRRTCAYGIAWNADQKRMVLAHRFAWELLRGQIPSRTCVLHRCDEPRCCNPAHLFLGTQLDNMRDMAAKGRRSPEAHAKKGVKFSDAHRAALSAAQRARHARRKKQVA